MCILLDSREWAQFCIEKVGEEQIRSRGFVKWNIDHVWTWRMGANQWKRSRKAVILRDFFSFQWLWLEIDLPSTFYRVRFVSTFRLSSRSRWIGESLCFEELLGTKIFRSDESAMIPRSWASGRLEFGSLLRWSSQCKTHVQRRAPLIFRTIGTIHQIDFQDSRQVLNDLDLAKVSQIKISTFPLSHGVCCLESCSFW